MYIPVPGEDGKIIQGYKVSVRGEGLKGVVHTKAVSAPGTKHTTCVHLSGTHSHPETNLQAQREGTEVHGHSGVRNVAKTCSGLALISGFPCVHTASNKS